MRLMSACVKNNWLMAVQFSYLGYNIKLAFFVFQNDKGLCEGVFGVLFMTRGDCQFPLHSIFPGIPGRLWCSVIMTSHQNFPPDVRL